MSLTRERYWVLHSKCMDIHWTKLRPETLRAVVEEFISRDGTDYGQQEATFESKIEDVYRLLRESKARIVFDVESGSCNIVGPANDF